MATWNDVNTTWGSVESTWSTLGTASEEFSSWSNTVTVTTDNNVVATLAVNHVQSASIVYEGSPDLAVSLVVNHTASAHVDYTLPQLSSASFVINHTQSATLDFYVPQVDFVVNHAQSATLSYGTTIIDPTWVPSDTTIYTEVGADYIVSAYVHNLAASTKQFAFIKDDANASGTSAIGAVESFDPGETKRVSRVFTALTQSFNLGFEFTESGVDFAIDGVQVERQSGPSTEPSPFKIGGITEIAAGQISTGQIDAQQIDVVNIDATNINTGTLDAQFITVSNLSASSINTGTLDASLATITNIDATNINTGTLDASLITVNNLSASSITTGVLDAGLITVSNLSADSITTGTLSANFIDGGTISGVALNIGSFFSVDATGVMTATSGTFSGSITGASGTFTGNISAASGTVVINSNGIQLASGDSDANKIKWGNPTFGADPEIWMSNSDNLMHINAPIAVMIKELQVGNSDLAFKFQGHVIYHQGNHNHNTGNTLSNYAVWAGGAPSGSRDTSLAIDSNEGTTLTDAGGTSIKQHRHSAPDHRHYVNI